MLSLAAGALLATAFMHLLPEAFESPSSAHDLFLTLPIGLVFFFLLDKPELWHHGHEHGEHSSLDQDPPANPHHNNPNTETRPLKSGSVLSSDHGAASVSRRSARLGSQSPGG